MERLRAFILAWWHILVVAIVAAIVGAAAYLYSTKKITTPEAPSPQRAQETQQPQELQEVSDIEQELQSIEVPSLEDPSLQELEDLGSQL